MSNELKRTAPDMKEIIANAKKAGKLKTVALNWKEVYYTNCPLVSASNVDQELGWTKEEYKKIGIQYLYLRARKENDWYPLSGRGDRGTEYRSSYTLLWSNPIPGQHCWQILREDN